MSNITHDRRQVLRAGAFAGLQALLARAAAGAPQGPRGRSGYGPLVPTPDETTGLPLIRLPQGFQYRTFGWTGDPLTEAPGTTPASHDGMGVVQVKGDLATLVRNHEVSGAGSPFGPPDIRYDNRGPGGTTRLTFDLSSGEWRTSAYGNGGTSRNCAGGVTPWGSWLTCEETIASGMGFNRPHGWIFEVPAEAPAHPIPLRFMGRFSHEAVCVDPRTGYVYETEDDRYTSGFYRFRPRTPNTLYGLEHGGVLEMLKVKGVDNADLMLVSTGDSFPVEWVQIRVAGLRPQSGVGPYGSFDGQTTTASGPFFQGYEQGGAQFRRLEGCWYDEEEGLVYFTDTEGGVPLGQNAGGALWCYDPRQEELRVVVASLPATVLRNPDNITVKPGGGILICEDNGLVGTKLVGLSRSGELFDFAINDVVLDGEVNGFRGSFRRSEWCGATFDPSGRWLFVNIQTPGITFAITGPWEAGPL